MSLKDNIAIHQLFDQLERRYALRILWALRDGYTVTLQGQDLLKRLNDLQAFANRWVKNKD